MWLVVLAAALAPAEIDGEALDRFIERQMALTQVPGVAVGIYHDGATYAQGFGVTSVDHPLRVTDETLFQIGSITKTFTGTIVMRLVDEGKVDLDAAVPSYVPEFRVADENASSRATVRHLLTHMGGWVGDYFDDTGSGADALAVMVGRMQDLEQLAPLGTIYSYNNSAFYAAGLLIEEVTGSSYEDALIERVLEPLEIQGCEIRPLDVMTRRFAVGHRIDDEEGPQVLRPWYLARAAFAAGGLACDVHGLLRYARFHLGDGSPLLAPDTLRAMHSTQYEKVGTDDEMAITWHVSEIDGARVLAHGGGTLGQISLLQLVPEHDFALAVVTNATAGGQLTSEVSKWALDEYLGLRDDDPEPMDPQPENLEAYVGTYQRPFSLIGVSVDGDELVVQQTIRQGFPTRDAPIPPPGPPARFQFFAPDRLVRIDGPSRGTTAEFVRREDGTIGWLRYGGRIHVREE